MCFDFIFGAVLGDGSWVDLGGAAVMSSRRFVMFDEMKVYRESKGNRGQATRLCRRPRDNRLPDTIVRG